MSVVLEALLRISVPVVVLVYCGLFVNSIVGRSFDAYAFPALVIGLLVPMLLVLLASELMAVRRRVARWGPIERPIESVRASLVTNNGYRTLGLVVLLVAFWRLLEPLGFPAAAALLSAGSAYLLGMRPAWKALVAGGLIAAGTFLVATELLSVRVPQSPWS